MSSVVISGNTSGTITLDAPAVAGTTTLTLPATSGTVVTKDTNGIISVNGIQFPATQSPSADANTLDDYEEGSWTPNYGTTGTAPSMTYANRNGYYIKIGKMVFISFVIEAATVSSTGTGFANITGLPFTASTLNDSGFSAISVGFSANWASSQAPINALVFGGNTFVRPYYMTSLGGNKLDSTSAGYGNSIIVYMAGCYYTN